jgi:hypothetical protein
MTHLASLEGLTGSLSAALIAGLWQGIALAILTASLLKFLPRTTATARFIIWSAVFAASATMPFLHLAFSHAEVSNPAKHLLLDARWSYLLAAIWLGASFLRLIRLTVEAVSLRKLWSRAQPVAPELLEAAALNQGGPISASSRLKRSGVERSSHLFSVHKIQICSTPDVDRPSVIGFFAPKILIPEWLVAQLSATELRHIVLHEMEHLRRRDDWLNLLQKIGLVLFPLNPAMFWIDRRLSTEREIACDDGVLARTNAPRAYAVSLTSIAERRLTLNTSRRMVALALGALGAGALLRRRSEFATRIESILGQRPASRPAVAALLVAGVLSGTAVMAHAPDLVIFGKVPGSGIASVSSTPDRVLPTVPEFTPTAKFETASYRVPEAPPKSKSTKSKSQRTVLAAAGRSLIHPTLATKDVASSRIPQPQHQWMVLTSWEETPTQRLARAVPAIATDEEQGTDAVIPVSRVIVRTVDGRFFVAPYAAVPTQAGWLIVQL